MGARLDVPPATAAWLERRLRAAEPLALLLDFDGTLAEIAETPGQARLDPGIAGTLDRLAQHSSTRIAVVSGRTVDDLRALVPQAGLYLAGNQGLEVAGPTLWFRHPDAAAGIARVRAIAADLRTELARVPGALVEEKVLSVACHDRAVAVEARPEFRSALRRALSRNPGPWRVLRGRRVVELVPSRRWTKGSCARLLLSHFESLAPGRPAPFAIAMGDDQADRDLLDEVRGRGFTVAVGTSLGSGWDLHLPGVAAVARLLEAIERIRAGTDGIIR